MTRPAFDGERAMKVLVKQCAFGPRVPGTQPHEAARAYLAEELRKYADKVTVQAFQYDGIPMQNIIGVFNPEASRRILLCAHWDSRPHADMELDAARRKQAIPGANDGASGVAVLMELARLLKQQRPDVGVVIALLDGEDYGNFDTDEGVLLGAKYLARHYTNLGAKPVYGVLLDMVGDRDLVINRERNSQRVAPDVNDKVFQIAQELGYGKHLVKDPMVEIVDDHIPLSRGGIPTIDLIDFNYGPWHTLDDTPDKCSAASLAVVGETVAELVYRERGRP